MGSNDVSLKLLDLGFCSSRSVACASSCHFFCQLSGDACRQRLAQVQPVISARNSSSWLSIDQWYNYLPVCFYVLTRSCPIASQSDFSWLRPCGNQRAGIVAVSLTFKVPVTPGAQLTIISFTTYLFNSWLVNMCCTMSQEFQEIII